ncbi:UvrD-helicase domain-containing protein [Rhizosphaericola mali]|uniref:RecBCD enzyme subunit RecB n=1 Tax=Rhizosphaericola mali TaxID=2545455 RepID=A0A5P2G7M9_9BACT|nr:UvrD-helicase domain-containing protein [Rhizosphaericola mali]QES89213.1 AAA family ATPase [Rhizosphaericola mali]
MKDLKVWSIELSEKNLIEASAGTGKTYSIGILVLRLIIENELNINEILMVTFTKSAVEELKTRVNKFCREALYFIELIQQGIEYTEQLSESEKTEFDIYKNLLAFFLEHPDKIEKTLQRLKANILLLDEVAIMTIHGFCQKSLTEFAFESKQLFGAELIQDTQPILENALNEFWRKNISTLSTDTLQNIGYQNIRENILKLVSTHLDGKFYANYDPNIDYAAKFKKVSMEDCKNQILAIYKISYEYVDNLLKNNVLSNLIENTDATKSAKKNYLEASDPIELCDVCWGKNGFKYNKVTNAFDPLLITHLEKIKYLSDADNLHKEASKIYRQNLYAWAIQEITDKYHNYLKTNNLLSYNDLISNMAKAVENSESFVTQLQKKYKAVFVDEFQDTDSEQYTIFQKTFGYNDAVIFLIGDSKQSIYAWRKADLDTYFEAKNNVGERIFSMKTNFRSGKNIIDKLNYFFQPYPDFDTFSFPDQTSPNRISYINVDAQKTSLEVTKNGEVESGLQLWSGNKNEVLINKAVQLTHQLLTDTSYKIQDGKKAKKIEPKDIGIIVRTNSKGSEIKKELSRIGIPSVMLYDQKVLTSDEAKSMYYLLEAIIEPKINNIFKVLKSNILNYENEKILHLDTEDLVQRFYQLRNKWGDKGIYPTLQAFFIQFDIEGKLKSQNASDRIWANVTQIAEILNKAEQKQNLKEEDLRNWLKKRMDGREEQGDEYLMRIESDENAVTIITIHKSKGLEYGIVICPEVDFSDNVKSEFVTFKDGKNFVTKEQAFLTEIEAANFSLELEQENRRLIYVALTRAKAQCHVLSSTWNPNSTMNYYYNSISNDIIEIQYIETIDLYKLSQYKPTKVSTTTIENRIELSCFKDDPWFKLSYTAIAAHHLGIPKERSKEFKNAYDEFIFSKLKFGALAGNLLHDILEKIDFVDSVGLYNNNVIKDTLHSYFPQNVEEYILPIQALIKNILNADILIDNQHIKLNTVIRNKRLSELEFDFPIRNFEFELLEHFSQEKRAVLLKLSSEKEVDGMMNGKIDLLFEYEGKLYILDWKTNYLGYELDDYVDERLFSAMNENNYHLQYLIYTVAVKKYIESRGMSYEQNFGGVIYLFLRGVRSDTSYGVFTAKPDLEEIIRLEHVLSNT